MRIVAGLFVAVLFLVGLVTPDVRAGSPSAHGNLHFSSDDGVLLTVHFNATVDQQGHASGDMRFTDPAATPEVDPDNPPDSENPPGSENPPVSDNTQSSEESTAGLSVGVVFDCALIVGNTAVMGGVVVDSTFPEDLGRRVLLAVEDNGQGSKEPRDRVAWGIYGNPKRTWIPSDAELEEDPGVGLTWIATDAEREDDVGVPSNRGDAPVDCNTFPLESYTFVDLQQGDGDVRVLH